MDTSHLHGKSFIVDRNIQILERSLKGETITSIAESFNISKSRTGVCLRFIVHRMRKAKCFNEVAPRVITTGEFLQALKRDKDFWLRQIPVYKEHLKISKEMK